MDLTAGKAVWERHCAEAPLQRPISIACTRVRSQAELGNEVTSRQSDELRVVELTA